MAIIRYGKTGLFGQENRGFLGATTPTYTPTPTPPTYTPPRTYTPPTPTPPTYTPPTYTLPRTYTPPISPPQVPLSLTYYIPPISPAKRQALVYSYQGTPSYVPLPYGTPTQINPVEAGLEPEGSGPAQLVYASGGYGSGGAYGPSQPEEAEVVEEVPPAEPKKTNWLLWLLLAAGAYLFLEGDIL